MQYKMPRVYIIGKAYISNMNLNVENYYIYFDIFRKITIKEMSDFNYFGKISGNNISFTNGVSAIFIRASGYTDSLENYLTESFNNWLIPYYTFIITHFFRVNKILNINIFFFYIYHA